MEPVKFPDCIPKVGEIVQVGNSRRSLEAKVKARWPSADGRTYFVQLDIDTQVILSITPDAEERGMLDKANNLVPYWRAHEVFSDTRVELSRPEHEEIYKTPRTVLSTRTSNCLMRMAGLSNLEEIANCSESYLLQLRNFGPKMLEEVKEVLASAGLSLRSND
ncbi:TPA: hypothetical protein DD449_02090 [Candidatus Berkelbacteria bacterium]|uniref:DNA-directed RNA polymerase subunit alpha, DNA-directed RNA polymerase subunit alpha n=1 Tax=Berkelbacteria bacterium GW2011_GWE1_39_12 TaxID=1618337 RepID=A0A0G4B4F0_9BACT|nr:MAG: DNA-directed RNA polymerase subunit alpha, DNA-directed RNA polymerase subunit alpha [Berkelbacteria bacterium GW2011_GWE1_39_12]HBO60449.1 hypothetical protein [Candidatus Berkelbacteria bacterium]